MEPLNIGIVGGGIAGLFTAWYLRQMAPDAQIHLYDQGVPGGGTTRAAGGMLTPSVELEFQEKELYEASRASLALYLSEVAPALPDIGLVTRGTLEVGLHPDDVGYLKRLFAFQQQLGIPVEWLSGGAVHEAEPLLAKSVQHAIHAPQDVQVDQWRLCARLVEALKAGGTVIHSPLRVEAVEAEGGNAIVRWSGGSAIHDKVVISVGVPPPGGLALPFKVYPVRGEMLSLRPIPGATPEKTVRMRSLTYGMAYVVPKADRILLGSTSEEKGHRAVNTAGGLLDILRKCHAVLPCLYEMEIIETWAGLRPAALSRMPVLHQEPGRPVYHLNGLFRHGILLGPLMGKAAAQFVLIGERLPEVAHFGLPDLQPAP